MFSHRILNECMWKTQSPSECFTAKTTERVSPKYENGGAGQKSSGEGGEYILIPI
jgi:hypothetical protein